MNTFTTISFALLVFFGIALVWSLPTLILWNWLMPTLFQLPTITWAQALGVNFLSGILFKPSTVNFKKDK